MTFSTPYHAFVALASLDASRVRIARDRQKALEACAVLRAELDALNTARAADQKALLDARRAIAQQEHAISQLRLRKQRSLDLRDRATSVRERQALEADAAQIDDQIDREETQALADLERFEQQTATFQANASLFDSQVAQKKAEIAIVEQSIEQLTHEYDRASDARGEILDAVEPTLRERYESLRERDALAAAPVVANRCGGCHTLLTASDLLSLRRHTIVTCPECYKILYTPV
jgi:hypothetical protein